MTTTKFKLNRLAKHKNEYLSKVRRAFSTVKKEVVAFLNDIEGEPDYFLKYLAMCASTNDADSFIKMLQGIINDAKACKGDPQAFKAIIICRYILLRLYCLSNFTIQWTNVTKKCHKCKRTVKTNFLFTDKLCPYCGSIIF